MPRLQGKVSEGSEVDVTFKDMVGDTDNHVLVATAIAGKGA
jgi:hypothetical protein